MLIFPLFLFFFFFCFFFYSFSKAKDQWRNIQPICLIYMLLNGIQSLMKPHALPSLLQNVICISKEKPYNQFHIELVLCVSGIIGWAHWMHGNYMAVYYSVRLWWNRRKKKQIYESLSLQRAMEWKILKCWDSKCCSAVKVSFFFTVVIWSQLKRSRRSKKKKNKYFEEKHFFGRNMRIHKIHMNWSKFFAD